MEFKKWYIENNLDEGFLQFFRKKKEDPKSRKITIRMSDMQNYMKRQKQAQPPRSRKDVDWRG
jgi:hypothetical protein